MEASSTQSKLDTPKGSAGEQKYTTEKKNVNQNDSEEAQESMDGSPATSQEELKREENTYSTRQELVQESKNNEIIAKVFDWAVQQMQKEKQRLSQLGVEPIDLEVVDMSVIMKGKKNQINRIIFNSEFDFKKVDNILLSQSFPCELKPGFQYVNVVLYASSVSELPLLFPYIYKTRLRKQAGKNNLKHWALVNKNLEEAYHMVSNFETIR